MTVLASDTFNRADETPLAAPWTVGTGLSTINLVSNAVSSPLDGNNHAALYTGITWPDDQYSKAQLSVTSTNGVRRGPGLHVRFAAAANTNYRFTTDHAAATNCNISRFITGTRTTILDFTHAWTNGDEWTMAIAGPANAARISMYHLGVLVAQVTDNSTLASGNAGIAYGGNVDISAWSADNWEGGDLGATLAWIGA